MHDSLADMKRQHNKLRRDADQLSAQSLSLGKRIEALSSVLINIETFSRQNPDMIEILSLEIADIFSRLKHDALVNTPVRKP
jgi:prefoldin subunit 5